MNTQIVVIGAGYGGMVAALRLAGRAKGLPVDITLVNASDTFVERIRLHQVAASQSIRQHTIPDLLRGKPIRFVRGMVTALQPDQRTVLVETGAGIQRIPYDYLVYALGSVPDTGTIPGVSEHTYGVGHPAAAQALRKALATAAETGGQVVVVGGGLTGIETATEIAESYPDAHVSLVTSGTLGATLSNKGRAHIARVFGRLGITTHEQAAVKRVEAGQLALSDGSAIPFDVCAWAGSFRALPLARESGLAVNARGQIEVDACLRSRSHPEIYAVGDAALPVEDTGAPIRMACATAEPMGAHTADNLLASLRGKSPQPFSFGYFLQCISLGRRDGLIQFVNVDDSPKESILTGRTAAAVKELICRLAWWGVAWTVRWPGWYRWPSGRLQESAAKTALQAE